MSTRSKKTEVVPLSNQDFYTRGEVPKIITMNNEKVWGGDNPLMNTDGTKSLLQPSGKKTAVEAMFVDANGDPILKQAELVDELERVLVFFNKGGLKGNYSDKKKGQIAEEHWQSLESKYRTALQNIKSAMGTINQEEPKGGGGEKLPKLNSLVANLPSQLTSPTAPPPTTTPPTTTLPTAPPPVTTPTPPTTLPTTPPPVTSVGEEEEEEETLPPEQQALQETPAPPVSAGNEGVTTAVAALDANEANTQATEAATEVGEPGSGSGGEIQESRETGGGNFIDTEIFRYRISGEGDARTIEVIPNTTYSPFTTRTREIETLALYIQEYYNRDAGGRWGTDPGRLASEFDSIYGEEKSLQSIEDLYANFTPTEEAVLAGTARPLPPLPTTFPNRFPASPTVPPTTNPLNPALPAAPLPTTIDPLDGSLNPGTAGSVPIGDTSLNPLADGEDGDEEQPTGPQVAIQSPPTKLKPRYHKESIKIFFGNDENPPWDLQLERSISELTWGKEGFNRAMNGLIEKHSMDFFIWEKKSDGTQEEFNEICQVYFCFLRQLQRGSRAPTANVPLSALLGFGNKLAQAAGGLGDATFSSTEGGMAGGAGGVTTRTRPPPYGPFQGVSPYNLPPGQKGAAAGGPFSGKFPYEVPKGKQSNKSLRSMVKTAAMMEAEKLVRVPQNEAITRVVDAFDKRPMNWANKPLANEYIVEAAARLPRGNLEGGADPKDPTDAFQYGIATPAARAFNFKIRKPPVVKTVRNF